MQKPIFKRGQVWRSPRGVRYEIVEVRLHSALPAMAEVLNVATGRFVYWKADKNLVNWHLESSALASAT